MSDTEAERLLQAGDACVSSGDYVGAADVFRAAAFSLSGEAEKYRRAWETQGSAEYARSTALIQVLGNWFAAHPQGPSPEPRRDTGVTWGDIRLYTGVLMGDPLFRALARYFEETTLSMGWYWPNMGANPLHITLAKYFGVAGYEWSDLGRIDLKIVIELFGDAILRKREEA